MLRTFDDGLTAQFLGPRAVDFALHFAARAGDVARLKELVASDDKRNLELQHFSHGTPLHAAVIYGQVDAIKFLLSQGVDPNALAPDSYGEPTYPALTLAAHCGQRAVVKALWDAGVHRAARTSGESHTALEVAASRGFSGLVRDFLEWWDGWGTEATASALELAASRWETDVVEVLLGMVQFERSGLDKALIGAAGPKRREYHEIRELKYTDRDRIAHRKVISALLDAGADPNCRDPATGRRPVHSAAQTPEAIEGLRILLEKGADVNAQDRSGRSAIFHAAARSNQKRSNEGIAKLLLQNGASADIQDTHGEIPINIAAYHGPVSLFQLFPDNGADPFSKNLHGETPLHRAAMGCQLAILEFLLAAGANINETSSTGWTALIFAVGAGFMPSVELPIARFLLSRGADVRTATIEGWTALHRATDSYNTHGEATELVELLLAHGADTEARAVVPGQMRHGVAGHHLKDALIDRAQKCPEQIIQAQTPLHWAAENGSVSVVEALLRHGANPSARDSTGATPAIRAATSTAFNFNFKQKRQVMKLLLEAGAKLEDEDGQGVSAGTWAQGNGLPSDWAQW